MRVSETRLLPAGPLPYMPIDRTIYDMPHRIKGIVSMPIPLQLIFPALASVVASSVIRMARQRHVLNVTLYSVLLFNRDVVI